MISHTRYSCTWKADELVTGWCQGVVGRRYGGLVGGRGGDGGWYAIGVGRMSVVQAVSLTPRLLYICRHRVQ